MKFSVLKVLRNIFCIISGLLSAFVLVLICTGTHSFAVQSDSMSPMLHRGDMVCVRRIAFNDLQEGDVISAHFPESDGVYTHRIVSVDREKQLIYTRGDGNNKDDPMPTAASRIIGKYWFSLPYVGFLALYFKKMYLIYFLLGVALVLIIVRVFLTVRNKTGS